MPYKNNPYNKKSIYRDSRIIDDYLGVVENIPYVPIRDDDEFYVIPAEYDKRPDLAAYAFFGSTRLWWVFAKRNINILVDPIEDFEAGTEIRIPDPAAIKNRLGS